MVNVKEALGALVITGGWTSMLASVVFYLFHWRVANEPGAGSALGLLFATICAIGVGALLFIGGHIYLIINKSWWLAIAWAACVAVGVGAAAIAPIVLLMMV